MEPLGDDLRSRVTDAAAGQLAAGGITRFKVPYIANRAEVDEAVVDQEWPDLLILLMDAWASRLAWTGRLPDTGSLNDDLRGLAELLGQFVQSADGRALLRSSLAIDGLQQFAQVRGRFWAAQFAGAAEIFRRAQRRGESRCDVDPVEAARMFCTALYFDVLYLDGPVPAEYLDSVVEIVCRGIAATHRDSARIRRDLAERLGNNPRDVLGEEHPPVDYSGSGSARIKEAILDAAIREATLRGPELVTRDAIARRAAVTTQVVERMWPDQADLLREAGDRARQKSRPIADTGSLWGDLLSFTEAKDRLISTPEGRANFLKTVLRGSDGRSTAVVTEFWLAGLKESTQVCLRAQHRGELRDGVNPDHATRALAASLYYDLFFEGGPMRADYTALVLDVFVNGIGVSGT